MDDLRMQGQIIENQIEFWMELGGIGLKQIVTEKKMKLTQKRMSK
jgi:hypothetical protein